MATEEIGAAFSSLVGAKLGAIRCRLVGTVVDACGIETAQNQEVWTRLDICGRRLEIYGSEGWEFESLRAGWRSPLH